MPNVAQRLSTMAAERPEQIAVVVPAGRDSDGKRLYDSVSFRQLDRESSCIASGLSRMGAKPGTRIALLVPPSIEFIALVFGLLKAGVVVVLIDPGMGRRNLVRCLQEAKPEGFAALPIVHYLRRLLFRRFYRARFNVSVGSAWGVGATTLEALSASGDEAFGAVPRDDADAAAIIFTTGSTGPPKGVLYRHGNFNCQVDELRHYYKIEPGEIDLPGFPLFGLFNAAMGVTTVVPDMDPTRPARVNPRNIIDAALDWQPTQAFGSPAMWTRVGQYCEQHCIGLPSIKRVLSAGAPVPPEVLAWMKSCIHPDGQFHTPYGATEALPVASIEADEVLAHTALRSAQGAGTCVGRKFRSILWKVIGAVDGPIARWEDVRELPPGEIGELIVAGPQVTSEYATRTEWNLLAKISQPSAAGTTLWHRMGDVGYLDAAERFWFCGRAAHTVHAALGPMYTACCEAIFNQHADVYRSALVGLGEKGAQRPVVVVEPWPGKIPRTPLTRERFQAELLELAKGNPRTKAISDFLFHSGLPVDIRHNSKIFREKLVPWARRRVKKLA